MYMILHCGGRGVLRRSFLLAWLAEEFSRWKKIKVLYNCSRRRTWGLELLGGGVYGGKGVGKVQVEDMAARRTFRPPQYMGDCQNYGPFLGPKFRPRIIIGTQKGTIILTIPQINIYIYIYATHPPPKLFLGKAWPARLLGSFQFMEFSQN